MANSFGSASKKIQDLMTLYAQLDSLPSRSRWHFEPKYDMCDTCAFVFTHQTGDASKRYNILNELADVLYSAGIKSTIQAKNGVLADVVIAPEYAELARKMFARYQTNKPDVSKVNNALLEQEWLCNVKNKLLICRNGRFSLIQGGKMKKKTLLICNGLSGSGKTYFIQNTLPAGLFYSLKSMTTRPMRPGESEGNPYFFRSERDFDTMPLVTHLWVNQALWVPGMPKWLYGVPESEVLNHLNQNLVYDVIQPCYTRQMIDWFRQHDLDKKYNFRVAYFLTPDTNLETARGRANMPNDTAVRAMNTCTPEDFLDAGIDIDYILKPRDGKLNPRLMAYIKRLQHQR